MSAHTIRGIGASAGIAIRVDFRYETQNVVVDQYHADDAENELARLKAALAQAQQEVQALLEQAQKEVGIDEASIFEAHVMFLSEPELLQEVQSAITTERMTADYAWQEDTGRYTAQLREIGDEYLSAHANDIENIANGYYVFFSEQWGKA
jgi:phosphoenolpyruvate-protein phosphotransferase (PTS system enzyme I)